MTQCEMKTITVMDNVESFEQYCNFECCGSKLQMRISYADEIKMYDIVPYHEYDEDWRPLTISESGCIREFHWGIRKEMANCLFTVKCYTHLKYEPVPDPNNPKPIKFEIICPNFMFSLVDRLTTIEVLLKYSPPIDALPLGGTEFQNAQIDFEKSC